MRNKHPKRAKRGRPSKSYRASWGELIDGLRREANGQWRIVATRKTFTQPDERLAIARYKSMVERTASGVVRMRHPLDGESLDALRLAMANPSSELTVVAEQGEHRTLKPAAITIDHLAPTDAFWHTVRQLLIDRPQLVADMTGIPQLASLADLPMPKPSLKLKSLLAVYMAHNRSSKGTKQQASNIFNDFIRLTGATTLADLTVERLKAYREHIQESVASPGTIAAYYGRIKNIIRFATTEGEDTQQIDACLSRMAILKPPTDNRIHKPTPISRNDFQTILATAKADYTPWYARLLLMLNCCLHFDEALGVQWEEFDLQSGTFCSYRNKRGKVIRAACLWDITVDALQAIKRTGSPYVFVSQAGTRFNSKGQWKTWNKIRIAAGAAYLQMDDIRDGAYTAASLAAGVDEKYARLFAGHRSHGLQDNYVQRNPSIVKPATDAVYAYYF